jgi:hypothetical protein
MNILERILRLGAAAAVVAALLPAFGQDTSEEKYKFTEKDEIRQTLRFADPAKSKALRLDNVWGGIEVQAYEGKDIELVARKTIRAKSQDRVEKAKKDVKLDISADGGTVDIYVDGPFRCQYEDCRGVKQRDFGYEVKYDFVLNVPRAIDLALKTVIGGDVVVRGVEGAFEVVNVTGKVTMEDVAGGGEARTVNGPVRVRFAKNPTADCSFKTVNGDVEIAFRAGLGADVRMKTFNGKAFSDFEATLLPPSPIAKESKETKSVYKRDRFTHVRIGRGGPAITCDTMNGDILLKKIS